MSIELQRAMLVELRTLVRLAANAGANPHRGLSEFLAQNYLLPKEKQAEILRLVSGYEREKGGNDQELLEKIRGLVAYLGIKPRNYDPENIDFTRMTNLINNRLVHLSKNKD